MYIIISEDIIKSKGGTAPDVCSFSMVCLTQEYKNPLFGIEQQIFVTLNEKTFHISQMFYVRMDSISRLKSFLPQITGTGYKGLASFLAQVIIRSMSSSLTTSNLSGRPIFLMGNFQTQELLCKNRIKTTAPEDATHRRVPFMANTWKRGSAHGNCFKFLIQKVEIINGSGFNRSAGQQFDA